MTYKSAIAYTLEMAISANRIIRVQKVRDILEEQGRNRKWLAIQCELSHGSISAVLSGHRNISFKALTLMAKALDVPLETIYIEPIKKIKRRSKKEIKYIKRKTVHGFTYRQAL